jgi:hypothetical protein
MRHTGIDRIDIPGCDLHLREFYHRATARTTCLKRGAYNQSRDMR